MKITALELKNIKCFKNLKISFEDQGTVKNWSLVVGNNGQGKTTILRSIAIGLCDKEGASALLAELHGGFLRQSEDPKESEDLKTGYIKISLKDTDGSSCTITTTIELNGNNETISQEIIQGDINRDNLFAVAYGSGRTIRGTDSYEEYALVDSIYTLFNYETRLQNPELAALRVERNNKEDWKILKNILKKVLMLKDEDNISLEKAGLYVTGKWGKVSFNSLSDGYQSLTSIILDFISWQLLNKEKFNLCNDSLSGIFIIDEIEQHLHPAWQRSIIKILSKQFPNIQFICSTHSPLCALGLADLDNQTKSQLIKAGYVHGHSEAEIFNLQDEFKGYRADQILTSEIFDLKDSRSIAIEDKLNKYAQIYKKTENSRTEKENNDFENLKSELKDLPLWDNQQDREQREKILNILKNNTIAKQK